MLITLPGGGSGAEDVAFGLSARDIIRSALYDAGIVPLGRDPKANEMAECIRRANMMLKTWAARDLLWRQETMIVFGGGNEREVALPEGVRAVSGVRYVESATNERALSRFERDDYRIIPNKGASGTPTIFNFEMRRDMSVLNIWPVPKIAYELAVDAMKTAQVVVDPALPMDVPEEWHETVMKGVAARCARIFLGETPADLAVEAARLEQEMFDHCRPASYMLGAY